MSGLIRKLKRSLPNGKMSKTKIRKIQKFFANQENQKKLQILQDQLIKAEKAKTGEPAGQLPPPPPETVPAVA